MTIFVHSKVEAFVHEELFDRPVELEDPNILRNIPELAATKTLLETFKKAINALNVRDKGDAEIRDTIKLRQTRPFVAKNQATLFRRKEFSTASLVKAIWSFGLPHFWRTVATKRSLTRRTTWLLILSSST